MRDRSQSIFIHQLMQIINLTWRQIKAIRFLLQKFLLPINRLCITNNSYPNQLIQFINIALILNLNVYARSIGIVCQFFFSLIVVSLSLYVISSLTMRFFSVRVCGDNLHCIRLFSSCYTLTPVELIWKLIFSTPSTIHSHSVIGLNIGNYLSWRCEY